MREYGGVCFLFASTKQLLTSSQLNRMACCLLKDLFMHRRCGPWLVDEHSLKGVMNA